MRRFLPLLLLISSISAQDDNPCHANEDRVVDSRGGYHCVIHPQQRTEEWSAQDCVKNFKVDENTTLIAPLDDDGNPVMSQARLEHFQFKMVCGIQKTAK